MIRIETSMGDSGIELFTAEAPKSAENFLKDMGDGH
jgi:cyclophilin family peptidyl-prolyl cis-trans isomerase